MAKFDIARLNAAVDKLLETTDNPRHRFLLQAFGRHRHLEVAGRYEEICAPDMMTTDPVYHFHYTGLEFELRGQDQVKGLYRMWAETDQIFFPIHEEVAMQTTSLHPSPLRTSRYWERDRGRPRSCPICQALLPTSC